MGDIPCVAAVVVVATKRNGNKMSNETNNPETVKVRHVYTFPDYAEEVATQCDDNADELVEALREAIEEAESAASAADDAQDNATAARDEAETAADRAREAVAKLERLVPKLESIAADESRRAKWVRDAQADAYDTGFNAGWVAAMAHARRATHATPEVTK